MPSLRSRIVAWSIRHLLRPGLDATRPPESVRLHVERFQKVSRLAKNIVHEEIRLGGRPTSVFRPRGGNPSRAILYLHGGAYVFGSPNTHRSMTSRFALAAGCSVYSLDYRLAPEHPAPAALEDAKSAFAELSRKYGADNIVVAGDSAGGGLSLALGFSLRDAELPQPRGYMLFCPWGDLEMNGESVKRNRNSEPMLTRENVALCAEYYAADMPLSDPFLSPVHGNYEGLNPMYVQAAGKDILLDDGRAIAQAAKQAGVRTKIDVFAEMFHAFQAVAELIPEGQRALILAGAWIKAL